MPSESWEARRLWSCVVGGVGIWSRQRLEGIGVSSCMVNKWSTVQVGSRENWADCATEQS